MNNKLKISIIVPVFNAEKHLDKCLSFLDNSPQEVLQHIEVICINDGSTDSSLKILETKSTAFERFTVINQENRGAANARNAGLNVAKGEYIFFVDSDDYIFENGLSILIERIESQKDIYQFSTLQQRKSLERRTLIKETTSLKKFLNISTIASPLWNYIFKRSVIEAHNLRFIDRAKYSEDTNFTVKFIALIESAESISDTIYVYDRTNQESLMNRATFEYQDIESHLCVLEDMFDFSKRGTIRNREFLNAFIHHQIGATIDFAAKNNFKYNGSVFNKFCDDYKALHEKHINEFLIRENYGIHKKLIRSPRYTKLLFQFYRYRL